MTFASLPFGIFLVVLIVLLVLFKQALVRKWILLAASIVFYAWWDVRFAGLLCLLILVDYFISRALIPGEDQGRKRKLLLWVGILINLVILGFFKYFNFFVERFSEIAGNPAGQPGSLSILLPIGLSFYTFQSISYMIDVYKGVVKPAGSMLDYAVYIAFFPRLLAGPILRAREFLPQLERGVQINLVNLSVGFQYFLRGMLKKMVIADNLAVLVDSVYAAPADHSPLTVWLAVLSYAMQILFDFWGYTDMARGVAKVLGFDLPVNFDLPYTSQSISEFWNRWHISLSNWFRDYVFFPIRSTLMRRQPKLSDWWTLIVPSMSTMLLSGLWHGAGLNFLLWGGLHSLFIIQEHLPGLKPARYSWRSYKGWGTALLVFLLVTLIWIFFRSPDWQTTGTIFAKLLFLDRDSQVQRLDLWALIAVPVLLFGGMLARRLKWSWPILPLQKVTTWAFLLAEGLVIFFLARMEPLPFIYFSF